jgi:hypothetical protein|tara:strand:- start:42 stop:254 length:213 start_codon:yes stop_codon:yes gene_type:complete
MSDINNIRFPVPPVWWITWADNTETTVLGYGYLSSDEILSTMKYVTTYLDEAVWESVLIDHGIDPYPEDE